MSNVFYERLNDMFGAFGIDNECVEYIQWYCQDEDTDDFTRTDAKNIYDICVDITEETNNSLDPDNFDFMNTFTARFEAYIKLKARFKDEENN